MTISRIKSRIINYFLDAGVSNLRSTPSFVKAEHSANPAACICILKSSPALVLTHLSAFSRALKLIGNLQAQIFLLKKRVWKWVIVNDETCIFSINESELNYRRSFLRPQRIIGTFGQKCFTSGYHFSTQWLAALQISRSKRGNSNI
jgi:hypothetical protein